MIRPYEKPLLALGAVLLILLAAAIYAPVTIMLATTGEGAAATPDATPGGDHHKVSRTAASSSPISSQGAEERFSSADHRLLCAPLGDIKTAGNRWIGIAADRAGPSYGNETHLKVGSDSKGLTGLPTGGEVGFAGDGLLTAPTVERGGSLITSYDFTRGIRLTQRLSLERTGLRVTYNISNGSDHQRTVALCSVLSPVPTVGPEKKRAPFRALAGVQDHPLKNDLAMPGPGEFHGMPDAILAPRRGAASDATGAWSVSKESQSPNRVAVAGYHRISEIPFDSDALTPYDLPGNAALAAYWENLRIAPHESVTLSERYTQPGSGGS